MGWGECGIDFCSLRHLDIWSPVRGTVWVGSGGVALLEEVYHSGRPYNFNSHMPSPVRSFCLLLVVQPASSRLFSLPAATLHRCDGDGP